MVFLGKKHQLIWKGTTWAVVCSDQSTTYCSYTRWQWFSCLGVEGYLCLFSEQICTWQWLVSKWSKFTCGYRSKIIFWCNNFVPETTSNCRKYLFIYCIRWKDVSFICLRKGSIREFTETQQKDCWYKNRYLIWLHYKKTTTNAIPFPFLWLWCRNLNACIHVLVSENDVMWWKKIENCINFICVCVCVRLKCYSSFLKYIIAL